MTTAAALRVVERAPAGGIVLAGGRSTRMGTPKAWLDWHGSTLLQRVVGIVGRAVDGPVVVVSAAGQELPALPPSVLVIEDAREARGPLQGLATGLGALLGAVDVAFVSSTDVPLLHPAFVRRVVAAVDDAFDVALPEALGHRHPLAAAYRPELLPIVEELLAAGRGRPAFLFERCRVCRLGDAALLADPELAAGDPHLESLRNLNEPADYAAAEALPEPYVRVERFGTLRPAGSPRPVAVRAGTVGAAADAVGTPLDGHVVAAVNGDQISADPHFPLVDGDVVSLMSAEAGG